MARSINRIILVGNAGSDPDVRETNNGTPVAHLSLATDRFFRQNGEEQRKTDWHRLTFWGKACDIAWGAAEITQRPCSFTTHGYDIFF